MTLLFYSIVTQPKKVHAAKCSGYFRHDGQQKNRKNASVMQMQMFQVRIDLVCTTELNGPHNENFNSQRVQQTKKTYCNFQNSKLSFADQKEYLLKLTNNSF